MVETEQDLCYDSPSMLEDFIQSSFEIQDGGQSKSSHRPPPFRVVLFDVEAFQRTFARFPSNGA
jgi:hypothetical protein